MSNFIPLNKQSKKLQKEFHSQKRSSWNGVNPVSRIMTNKRIYNRKKQSKNFDCFEFCVCDEIVLSVRLFQ